MTFSFSDFIQVVEAVLTALALVGTALSLYLLRAERQDRALTIAENGRTGILSWSLVLNESLRVTAGVILLAVGIVSLATPNQNAPVSLVSPLMPVTLLLFAIISVGQSTVLIYARQRIARYPVAMLAKQETLLEVQRDVSRVYEKAQGVDEKIADLSARATASEVSAHVAEGRADVAEKRADVSEKRADAAQERER